MDGRKDAQIGRQADGLKDEQIETENRQTDRQTDRHIRVYTFVYLIKTDAC